MARNPGKRLLPGAWAQDRHRTTDVLVAVTFGVAGEIETLIDERGHLGLLAPGALSGILFGGVLLIRRKRPLLSMTLFSAAALLSSALAALVARGAAPSNQVVPIFAVMVLSYSLGAFGARRDLLLGLPQPLAVVTVIDLLQPSGNTVPGAVAFFGVFLVAVPAVGGRMVRARQAMLDTVAGQRRQLDLQRDMQARAAQAAERLRLAEELNQDLAAGLDALLTEVGAAAHDGADHAAVAAVENRARALLAQTRRVVVSLAAADSAPAATAPPGSAAVRPPVTAGRRTAGQAAITWSALAAAAVCAGLLLEVRVTPGVRVPMPVALLGCLVITAPLAVAWSRPLLLTAAAWAAAALFSAHVTPLGALFAAYSLAFLSPFLVAYFESRHRAAVGLGVCLLGGLLTYGWGDFARGYEFLTVLAAWGVGRVLAARSRLVEELRANNELLAAQHEASLGQAVAGERARIAREVHDSVGHYLTIIALQAGAARRLWAPDPARARAALTTIAQVAVAGAAELRMGLALAGDAAPDADIATLVGNARAAGLPVSMHAEGPDPDLPGDIKLTLFRLLQEALTNVMRHAPGATAEVTVRTRGSQIELIVSNGAGDQSATWTAGSSRGQRGMRQRAEEHGGHLECGRRPDGGYEVRVRFPLPEAVTT